LYASVGANLSGLNKGLSTAQGKLKAAGQGMQKIGAGMSLAITAPMMAIGKSVIKMTADFETEMARLSIASKGAAEESGIAFDDWRDLMQKTAIAVGGDTRLLGVSASGAAESMTGLYKAGLTTTEMFGDLQGYLAGTAELGGALRAAIDLAAATELDMVEASDLAAIALATFGGELKTEAERAQFATDAMNNFVKAADASVAEVTGLADALKNVGPTAAAFGWSLEDTNTALAILSERGIQGGEAGTALKSMMTNMMRQTDKTVEALQDLNIELYDVEGNMKSLPDIMAQFDQALNGQITTYKRANPLTKEQARILKAAQKAYDSATLAIEKHGLGLKKLTPKKLEEYNAQVINARDTIQQLEEAQGALVPVTAKLTEEQRNNYIQTIAGTYGMKAMQTLLAEGASGWTDMTDAIAGAAGIQEQAAAMTNTLAGQWEAMKGTLETLGITVGSMLLPLLTELVQNYITPFIDKLLNLNPEIMKWGLVLAGVAAAAGPLLMVLGTLVTVIGTIGAPVLAVIAAVGLLVAAFVTNFGGIRDAVMNAWAIVQPKLALLWEWLKTKLPEAALAVKNWFVETWNRIRRTVQDAVYGIAGHLAKLKPIFDEIKGFIITWVQEVWPKIQEKAQEVFAKVQDIIEHVASTVLPWLTEAFGIVVDWIITNWPKIKETIITVFEKVQTGIDTLKGFWETVLLPAMQTVWDWIEESLIPTFQTVMTWLETNIPKAIETLKGFWEDTLKPAMETVWQFIQDHLIPMFEAVVELFNVSLTLAITALQGLWENVLAPAIETVWDWIKNKLLPAMVDLKDKIWTTLKPKIEWLANFFKNNVKPAFEGVGGAIDKVTGWLQTLKDKIANFRLPDWLTPGSPTPFEMGLRGIAEAIPGIVDGFASFESQIVSVIGQVRHLATVEIPRLLAGLQQLNMQPIGGGNPWDIPTQEGLRALYGIEWENMQPPTPNIPGILSPIALPPTGRAGDMAGPVINININEPITVRDDRDIDAIALRIVKRLKLTGALGATYTTGTA
jgi:TP901 family phage tail tape measure protein